MNIDEIKRNAPDGADYYHKNLGYLKDVFGKGVKAKIYIDGEWKSFNIWKSLTTKEFKDIKPLY